MLRIYPKSHEGLTPSAFTRRSENVLFMHQILCTILKIFYFLPWATCVFYTLTTDTYVILCISTVSRQMVLVWYFR